MSEVVTPRPDGRSHDRGPDTRADLVLLSDLISRWVAEGIVTPAQAALMGGGPRTVVVPRAADAAGRGPSLGVEALGYLGGVIMLVGAVSIVGLYWDDLSTAVRVLLVGAVSALFYVAGLVVSPRLGAAAGRLRAVAWVGTTAAVGGLAALLAADVLHWDDSWVRVAASGAAAVVAGALWWANRVFVQQTAFFVALMVTAAMTTLAWSDGGALPGLSGWVVSVVWFALAWRGVVGPRALALPAASVGAIVAATTTFGSDMGMVLGLATAVAVVGLAVWLHDLPMVVVGSLGLLQMLPQVVSEWFPDTMAAPFVLLGVGTVVLGLSVWTAHRGRGPRPRAS